MAARAISKTAYQRLKASGKLGPQQLLVRRAIDWQSGTRAEIARRTGLRINVICGRVRELLDLGVVREQSRLARCSVTGQNAHVLTTRSV